MTPRLAISGSAGSGKTTLCTKLAQARRLPLVPEGMRARLEAGLDLHSLSHQGLRDLVRELFDEMLTAVAAHVAAGSGLVCDRAPVDFAAFWLYYGFAADEVATRDFLAAAEQATRHFDCVVVLPWGVLPLAADGVRSPNPWRQLHFQAILEGLAHRGFGGADYLFLPRETAGLEDRESWISARLDG